MKALIILAAALLILPPTACNKTTTNPATLAPGYLNTTDQTLGEALASLNGFVNQEKTNYASLSATQQATEKNYLNNLIAAVNEANAAYQAYHAGTQTQAQAQTAVTTAQTAQQALVSAKGVQ